MKRSGKNEGVALLLVIFAMALVIALGTAALVAANAAFASSTENASQQQTYLTACSYCDVLKAKLSDENDPLAARALLLGDGESLTLNADSSAAGDIGTAECVLTRTGDVLKVSVNASYNDEYCRLVMRFLKEGVKWTFHTFLKVD